jgi:hypothetical protein
VKWLGYMGESGMCSGQEIGEAEEECEVAWKQGEREREK